MTDADDFTLCCVRFLADDLTAEETVAFGERLVAEPEARALYRDVCRQATWLRELASAPVTARRVLPAPKPRRKVAARAALAAAAAAVAISSALFWPREALTQATVGPAVGGSPPPGGSVFLYPFEGFPILAPDDAPPLEAPFRVPALGEPDPRIVAIARRLSGLPPALSLNL